MIHQLNLFAPFDHQEYTVADHGGSLHSDGSGDYLVVDASSDFDLGTSDFTIEGWYILHLTAMQTFL